MFTKMAEILTNQLILPTNWIVGHKNHLDRESQSYRLLAAKQKFEGKIKNGNFENLYELIFHMLNMNSLTADHVLYDSKLKKHKEDDTLCNFIDMFEAFETEKLKKGPVPMHLGDDDDDPKISRAMSGSKMTVANQILDDARDIFFDIFKEYMSEAIKVTGDLELTMRNPHIHLNKYAYAIINVTEHDVYDIWRITFDSDKTLGSYITHAHTFTTDNPKEELSKMVQQFNKEEKKFPIHERNTLMVSLNKAYDPKQIAFLVKDILQLNKLFIGNAPMVTDIIMDIMKRAEQEKLFSYRLIILD